MAYDRLQNGSAAKAAETKVPTSSHDAEGAVIARASRKGQRLRGGGGHVLSGLGVGLGPPQSSDAAGGGLDLVERITARAKAGRLNQIQMAQWYRQSAAEIRARQADLKDEQIQEVTMLIGEPYDALEIQWSFLSVDRVLKAWLDWGRH